MIVAQEIPLDDISIVAALLHDVVEDTKITIADVEREFGKDIAAIVDGLTKIAKLPAGGSQEERQVESYRKLLLSIAKDARVIIVKLADRLHNMRTLQSLPPSKQKAIAQETLEIYALLAGDTVETLVEGKRSLDLSASRVEIEVDFPKAAARTAYMTRDWDDTAPAAPLEKQGAKHYSSRGRRVGEAEVEPEGGRLAPAGPARGRARAVVLMTRWPPSGWGTMPSGALRRRGARADGTPGGESVR